MKNPLSVNLPIKKTSSIGFVAMLLFAMAIVMMPASAVTVPAQSMFIDPTYPDPAMSDLKVNDTFTVDAIINVTSPTSPGGTGLFGWEYNFRWNNTVLDVTKIDTHGDNVPGGDLLPGHTSVFVLNSTIDLGDGRDQHSYAGSALTGVAFTGVASLCTYTFKVISEPISPEPAYVGLLDLQGVKLVDDTATVFVTDLPPTPAGTIQDGMYSVSTTMGPLANFTWSPETPEVDETVTFNGSLSTPNGGSIEFYAWNFSDGSLIVNETDPITTHSYAATGTYNVTLTVTNSDGLTNSATKSVTVVKAGSTISISASPPTVEFGGDTKVSGSIVPVRDGANVTIYYRPTGETWDKLASVLTNATSHYSYVWTPSALGTYEVNASWTGDANTNGSESLTITITVQDTTPPIIKDPSRTPSGDVLPDEDVRVSVNVTDAGSGVKNVTLWYTITNGTSWTDIEMTYNSTSELYNATIPGQSAFTWVKFNITAYDNAENVWTEDGAGVNFVYQVVPEFPAALVVPLFMIISLIAVILGKRRARNREHLH